MGFNSAFKGLSVYISFYPYFPHILTGLVIFYAEFQIISLRTAGFVKTGGV